MSFLSCSEKEQQYATLQGVVIGEIPEQIVYTATIDGTSFWDFAERVSPDSTGKFCINVPLQSPGFIRIFGQTDIVIIIEPNQEYNIEITNTTNKDTVIITSPHQQLQDYYGTLLNLNPRSCNFPYDNENFLLAYNNLDSMLEVEMQNFNNLLDQKQLSKELFEFVTTDRTVFYQSAKATIASKRVSDHIYKYDKIPLDTLELYRKAVMSIELDSPHLLAANFAYDFLYLYFWYNIRSTTDLTEFSAIRSNMRSEGKAQWHELELVKNLFEDQKIKEFYLASQLYFFGFRYKEETKPEYLQFKEEYPHSPYLKYLQPRYEDNQNS